ncbi:unnamed protein product [Meganyctiphanes norvegica]|uniref:C2H2-type domain-containing protein n=1 Tax=Meganyctiphanes norvegica TaxID=48144 RepID=A0AAV2STF3_MEGNR
MDDGLNLDDSLFDDTVPRKRRSSTRIMFKCTWVGCQEITSSSGAIERHVRLQHLGRAERSGTVSEMSENSESDSDSDDDHEEEFYWTEIEVNVATWVDPCEPLSLSPAPVSPPPPPTPPMAFTFTTSPTPAILTPIAAPQPICTPTFSSFTSPPQYIQVYSPPPTLSHMDMARPPHEDPEYRRQFDNSAATLSSSWPRTSAYLSSSPRGKIRVTSSPKASPGRGGKRNGDSRKCRKVYGMEQRDMWCSHCKWKKACTRFGD